MNIDDLSSMISSDLLNSSELSPDAYALAEVIKELLPLFKENVELYSDMRKKLVSHYLKQPALKIEESFSFELSDKKIEETKPNNQKLKGQLLKLAKQLYQLNQQTAETKAQTDKTVEQLNKEISDLKDQVQNYHMIIEKSSRFNSQIPTPARVSSKSSEFPSSLKSTPQRKSYTPRRRSPGSAQKVTFAPND